MRAVRGKVVVITGAASGIGAALATAMAAQGARLMLTDIAPTEPESLYCTGDLQGDNGYTRVTRMG